MIPTVSATDDPPAVLSLSDTINMALDANLNLKQSQDEVRAATENRKASITQFFPTLSASYDYVHRNREQTQELTGLGPSPDFIVRPDDEYTFVTSFNQPIFRGFSLINQFRIADLDLDVTAAGQPDQGATVRRRSVDANQVDLFQVDRILHRRFRRDIGARR